MMTSEAEMTQLPVNPAPREWMTDELVLKALAFAYEAHKTQVRKYTGEPYIYHPIEVAETLFNAFPGNTPPAFVLAGALLHDVVEDCGVTFTELRREFGDETAVCVMHLTDLITKEQGNRETRKFMEAVRISNAPIYAQLVKIADLISNSKSIFAHDPDFAVVYLREKARTLDAIAVAWNDNPLTLMNAQAVAFFQSAEEICRVQKAAKETLQ